jgi:hypothetical protein
MVSPNKILHAIKWSMKNIKGNISEKIIQNSTAHKLREMGIECQQEVVMPVLAENVFVGYNRFDLFVPYKKNGKTKILIVELKHLSQSIKKNFTGSRVHEQCIGYRACACRIFGNDVHVDVCVVNTWRTAGIVGEYNHELINVLSTEQSTDKKCKRKKAAKRSIDKKIHNTRNSK